LSFATASRDDSHQVDHDQDVHRQPGGLQGRRPADELVQLDGDEERGHDHGQPLGPPVPAPEPVPLDHLEHAVADRGDAEERQLVMAQLPEPVDQMPYERPSRVELDAAGKPVGEPAEVATRVTEEVDPGDDEQDAPDRALRGDPGKQASAFLPA